MYILSSYVYVFIYIYYVHKIRSIWIDTGIQYELMLIRESPI